MRRSRCQLYFRRPTDTIHPDIIIYRTCYVTAPATIASPLNDDEASLACLTGAKTSSERALHILIAALVVMYRVISGFRSNRSLLIVNYTPYLLMTF